MKRRSALLLAVFMVMLTTSAACKRGADSPDLAKLGQSSSATTTVLLVGSPHCPGGGIGIYTGNDTNGNGVLEASEVLKGSPVCDQLTETGSPIGNSSLVMVAFEPTGTVHCAAGGLKVLSGSDANKNGVLDENEIAFTEYLCNGAPGSSSAAGITVAVGAQVVRGLPGDGNKKVMKPVPAKKPPAAASRAPEKAAGKAAPRPTMKAKGAQGGPAAPAKKDSAEAGSAPKGKAASAEPAAPPKMAGKKTPPAPPDKEKAVSAQPAVPQGWTNVKVNAPQLASVVYKVEGRYILVRFTNLSNTSAVRFKYTVRWKTNQNGKWVEDSTMEGISFRLKPEESLDREVRTETQDFKDVVVDIDITETS